MSGEDMQARVVAELERHILDRQPNGSLRCPVDGWTGVEDDAIAHFAKVGLAALASDVEGLARAIADAQNVPFVGPKQRQIATGLASHLVADYDRSD